MHKKSTFPEKQFIRTLIVFIFLYSSSFAQDITPWTNGSFGQEWIDYSKKYVRIGVPSNGVYRVLLSSLPSDFPKGNPDQFQLWHRGKEVALISANSTEIVFYGEKNDGVSDGLMFRPNPDARLNQYYSFFSDEGSYFLTTSANRLPLLTSDGNPVGDRTIEPNHTQKDIYTFNDQFSYYTNGPGSIFNNSYFESFESYTGPTIYGANGVSFTGVSQPKLLDKEINLKNWDVNSSIKPSLEVMVNGLYQGSHNVQVYVGPTNSDTDLKNLGAISFSGLGGQKKVVNLNVNDHLTTNGKGQLRVKSTSTSEADWYGLTYYTITYPQLTDVSGVASASFNFPASSNSVRRVAITNASSSTEVYDITNPYNPKKIINGSLSGNTLTVDINSSANSELRIIVINALQPKAPSGIYKVDFTPIYESTNHSSPKVNGAINPSAYDYLIITNDNLTAVSKTYAQDYRSVPKGGSYRTLLVNIRSIYDEFNYGEPSPLAIRRFVNYMLKDGIREDKHNLLLIGHSVSWPYPGRLLKEMPGEVPTYGDPGSDILLVAGLQGTNQEVPAIPVGRISAFQPFEVSNYLAKVDYYEHETNAPWRKKVLHLVGGDDASQVNEFKDIFTGVTPYVTNLDNTRTIKTYTNNPPAGVSPAPTEIAPITSDVGEGVGMIAYYGHGKQTTTLLDVQYVSRANNPAYPATKKYPFVYFNGCGVGNIFSSRATPTLATDWLLTPDKGAIVIIANSYKSFVTPTKVYLDNLYKEIFLKTDANRRTIGQILKDVANKTITQSTVGINAYDVTNIHQTLLFGDPAVKILGPSTALPVDLISFDAIPYGNKQIRLEWKTGWERNNSHFVVERSYNAKNFEEVGSVEGKGDSSMQAIYSLIDKNPFSGTSYYRLRQVDKGNSINGQDGLATYSKIVSVTISDTDEVLIYPNPSSSFINVKLNVPTVIDSWNLIDISGRIVQQGSSDKISMEKFPTGNYVLEIYTKNGDVYHRNVLRK